MGKTKPCCALCGAPTALECGFIRCTAQNCRHTQYQNYAFQERPTKQQQPRFHNRERETAKRVDEEFE